MTPAPRSSAQGEAAAATTAVVAGATGEIGSAIAIDLAERGWTVVALARRPEPLRALAARHSSVRACPGDLLDDGVAEPLRAAVAGARVSLVVQAAGAAHGGSITDVPGEAVLRAVDVKVCGLLRLVRALEPALAAGARIVALGGSLGYDPTPDGSTAGIANAALSNAVRQLARALGASGFSCHVVAPGPIDSRRLRDLAGTEANRRGVAVSAVLDELRATSPLGRLTTVDEVAWAVRHLADPEAAALSGGTLLLDAGRRTAIP